MASSGIAAVSANWRSDFCDGLALQDRKRILAAARPRRFAANSVITNQGHPADRLFLLTNGRARYFFDEHGGWHTGAAFRLVWPQRAILAFVFNARWVHA